MSAKVKFCGLTRAEDFRLAAELGAAYVGLVHFARSPRHLTLEQVEQLSREAPEGPRKVALVVGADDTVLRELAPYVDWFQLHGRETPERVAEVRERFERPVMKAVAVGAAADVQALETYAEVADQLLIDAKPPKGAALPGGNGVAFDWTLIAGRDWAVPWMLAGGLTPDNVAEAIRLTGADQVDVSSGIESAPGVKDPARMAAFVEASRA
ncbi:MAG: phosphoribosylanthranilate isomerase [Pseudomonadota bacterium]